MMFKRNDGYALSYVLVVLLVLCIIATAVMAPPLRNLQMQQASIERMQEKYIAQGMVEQIVAQLEKVTTVPNAEDVNLPTGATIAINSKAGNESNTTIYTYKITAISNDTTITAEYAISEKNEDTATTIHSVGYESYDISHKTGGAG